LNPVSFQRAFSRIAAGLLLGMGLSMFWLWPSLPHDANGSWLHIWAVPPVDTLRHLWNGELLTGLRGTGLNTTHVATPFSSYALLGLILIGIGHLVRQRRMALLIAATLCLWLVLSPALAGPLRAMPFFERILYFRNFTWLTLVAIVIAAVGADQLYSKRVGRWLSWLLILTIGISAFKVGNSLKVEADFPQKRADLQQIAGWLREHAAGKRVYAEFSGHSSHEVSANYLRHLLPVMADVQEGASFVYENSFTAQVLQRKGIYWGSITPMADLAPSYGIDFLISWSGVAGSVLSLDPRWELKLQAGSYRIFQRRGSWSTPSPRLHLTLREVGANRFEFIVPEIGREVSEASTTVPYSPGWRLDEFPGFVPRSDAQGFLILDPSVLEQQGVPLHLRWQVDPARQRQGVTISLLAALALVVLIGWRAPAMLRLQLKGRWFGYGLAGLAVMVAIRNWQHLSHRHLTGPHEGFGDSPSMELMQLIGTHRDLVEGGHFQLVGKRWETGPSMIAAEGRTLRAQSPLADSPDIMLAVGGGVDITLTLHFTVAPSAAELTIALGAGEARRRFVIQSGQALNIPAAALAGLLHSRAEIPGYALGIQVLTTAEVLFSRLELVAGVHMLQLEAAAQADGDWGNQGQIGQWYRERLQNGLGMIARYPWPLTSLQLLLPDLNIVGNCHSVWWRGQAAFGGQRIDLVGSAGQKIESPVLDDQAVRWYRVVKISWLGEQAQQPIRLVMSIERRAGTWQHTPVAIGDALAFVSESAGECQPKG
jgi:hypothetical protein